MFPWLKRSFLNLWRKPFRTLLITVFLALVVGLFTVMATINQLAAKQFAELERALETIVDIRPIGSLGLGGRRSKPLPFNLEEGLRGTNPDLRVDPYLIHRELRDDRAEFYVGVRPGSPLLAVGDPEAMDSRVIAGRLFLPEDTNSHVAVVGIELARSHGIEPQGFDGRATIPVKGQSWRVIGLFDGGNGFTNSQVFLPFDAMRRAFKAEGISRIVIRAPSAAQAAGVADALRTELAGKADVVTNRPAVRAAQGFLAGISGVTRMGSAVFFVAGALVVMGAMMLAFRDQRREIGIEKALGASDSTIARRLLIESVLLTSLGGIGGLAVAWVSLSVYARSWTSIKFGLVETPLSPLTVAVILLACLALGALGSLYPVARSRKLDPVAILREE
ncbi:MAG: ABC transporter permease [Candidatus Binatia bacterium]